MQTADLSFLSPHHASTLENFLRGQRADPAVQAVLLGGSLAHGWAQPDSDVDVQVVLTAEAFARRRSAGRLAQSFRDVSTYPGGYVDAKYIDLDFLQQVAERGSDPARFAFQDARIAYNTLPGLETLLGNTVRFPVHEKISRHDRFAAQLLAWRWYFSEAERKRSDYLRTLAVQKLVLFSVRLVLNANEMLYPYHKWLLAVLNRAPHQPADFQANLDRLLAAPTWEFVDAHCRQLLAFVGLDFVTADQTWSNHFLRDSELRWMHGAAAIDDI